jgi:hypothetical protein
LATTFLFATTLLCAADGPPAIDPAKELAAAVGTEFIDPSKHERVTFDFTLRNVWGGASNVRMPGWREAKSGNLFLDDGFQVANPEQRKVEVTTLAATRPVRDDKKEEDTFARMELTAQGFGGQPMIPHAAWAAAAGDARLAAELLKPVQPDKELTYLEIWRHDRVWFHFAAMVHAYMQGEDEVALAHGQFLEDRYPKLAAEEQPQASELLADLRRRKTGPEAPAADSIATLPPERQIAAWIARLGEIEVRQGGQPGGVDLAEAPEVQALIKIGEPAIPALLDCFEHDPRLTRSVHFWRDFSRSRTVLGVHEAALTAIMSILRTEFYSPAATGSNITSDGKDRRERLAAELRAYWTRFGQMTFPERMMAVLTDRQADPAARQEAAMNLATPHARATYGTTVWTGSWENPGGKNPWIDKFSNPAIHEAILVAFDDEITSIHAEAKRRRDAGITEEDRNLVDPDQRPIDVTYETRNVARFFAETLGDLQDSRAAGTIVARAAAAEDPAIRSWLAIAAKRLGDPSALAELARRVVAKELAAPETDDHGAFNALYSALGSSPETKRDGLSAIAKRDHPWFLVAVDRVLNPSSFDSDSNECLLDPWCLTLLEEALHDTRETGYTDLLRQDDDSWEVFRREPNGNGNLDDGAPYLDTSKFDRTWNLRVCDRAAAGLLEMLGDHAQDTYEPLAKDRESTLGNLRDHLARYRGTFRELSDHLDGGTGFSIEGGRFLPILPSLDRAATAADVAAGRAVFHLPAAGAKPAIRTPLASEWLAHKQAGWSSDGKFYGRDIVILQVERDADGGLWFGIADGNGFHVVPSKEIGALSELPPMEAPGR